MGKKGNNSIGSNNYIHVCFVVNKYPHPHGGGGAGTYVQLVARELVKRGIKVSVVSDYCSECPEEYLEDDINIYRPKLSKNNLHWYFSKLPLIGPAGIIVRYLEQGWDTHRYLLRLNREYPIDVVEFAEGGDFWSAYHRPYSSVAHLHGSRYISLKMLNKSINFFDRIHRKLELVFIKKANWVFSPSKAMLDVVQKEIKSIIVSSSIVNLPVDPALGKIASDKRPDDRVTKILFVGGNQHIKGGDILLKAIEKVIKSHDNVIFIFLGCKPDEANNRIDIENGILRKPFLSKEDVFKEITQVDMCVIPSRWENSPNSIYEAMAAGKAVVASNVGGIPELVLDGETGLLFESENPDDLADKMISLILNKKLCRKMGRKGKAHIQNLASIEENVDKRMKIYQHILRERR